jgi:hypothetical protein
MGQVCKLVGLEGSHLLMMVERIETRMEISVEASLAQR